MNRIGPRSPRTTVEKAKPGRKPLLAVKSLFSHFSHTKKSKDAAVVTAQSVDDSVSAN
jgi:hypothetical protein